MVASIVATNSEQRTANPRYCNHLAILHDFINTIFFKHSCTMMQRALLRRFTPSLRRTFSTVEESAAAGMTLNFNLPHESIYVGAKVDQVIVPGVAGEYGVTADHVPLVAQLKPGVLQILHQGTAEAEKYFVAGGFSITHPNSTTVS